MLSINCWTANDQQEGRQIIEQTKQDKSKADNSFKHNLHTSNKIKQEIDHHTTGPVIEADRAEIMEKNRENIQCIHMNWVPQGHFFFTGQR